MRRESCPSVALIVVMIVVLWALSASASNGASWKRGSVDGYFGGTSDSQTDGDDGGASLATREDRLRERNKELSAILILIMVVAALLTLSGRVPWALFAGALVANFILLWWFGLFSPFLFLFIPVSFGMPFLRQRARRANQSHRVAEHDPLNVSRPSYDPLRTMELSAHRSDEARLHREHLRKAVIKWQRTIRQKQRPAVQIPQSPTQRRSSHDRRNGQ